MAGVQGGLIPKGTINSADIKNPSALQAQLHRDEAPNGQGTYYGKLDDGTEEEIGGPGSSGTGGGIPFANDTNADPNIVQLAIPGFVALVDAYTFEARILTDNNGDTFLQIGASGLKQIIDQQENALVGGELEDESIYLFAYNQLLDKYQLLGLARDNGVNGTPNTIAKFGPDGKTVIDSQITDDGTDVTVTTLVGRFVVDANDTVDISSNNEIILDSASDLTQIIGNDSIRQITNDDINLIGNDYSREVQNEDNVIVFQSRNHQFEFHSDFHPVQLGTEKFTLVGATSDSKTFLTDQATVLEINIVGSNTGGTGNVVFQGKYLVDPIGGTTVTVSESSIQNNQTIVVTNGGLGGPLTFEVTGEAGDTNTFIYEWKYITL